MEQIEKDELLRETFEAVAALVFYESGSGGRKFVTRHDIVDGRLMEGVPLSREALINLCAAANPEISETVSFIPPELLSYTPRLEDDFMAWYRPAAVQHIYFRKSTGIPSGPAPVPPLLFMVRRGGLRVYALGADTRPEPSSKAYHPPFFNTTSDGVCLGNVKAPATATPADITKWERAFWRSAFTDEGPPLLKGITGETLWKQLVNSGRKKFPAKYLRPCGKTVGQILEDS